MIRETLVRRPVAILCPELQTVTALSRHATTRPHRLAATNQKYIARGPRSKSAQAFCLRPTNCWEPRSVKIGIKKGGQYHENKRVSFYKLPGCRCVDRVTCF